MPQSPQLNPHPWLSFNKYRRERCGFEKRTCGLAAPYKRPRRLLQQAKRGCEKLLIIPIPSKKFTSFSSVFRQAKCIFSQCAQRHIRKNAPCLTGRRSVSRKGCGEVAWDWYNPCNPCVHQHSGDFNHCDLDYLGIVWVGYDGGGFVGNNRHFYDKVVLLTLNNRALAEGLIDERTKLRIDQEIEVNMQ